jgi:predicted RecB family nuclease
MRVMYLNTLPVTQAVRQVLVKNRLYSQVLELGIANLTALAQHIKPEVETLVGSQVNTNTIVVAIKRLVDSIEQETAIKKSYRGVPPIEVRMSLTDSVIDINCGLLESQDISAVLDQFFEKKDFSFNLYHTSKQFRLFADNKDAYNVIDQAITKQFRQDKEKKLSKITISFSTGQHENLNSLLFTISNIIYSTQIAIHSAFFTSSEIVLILEDRNATELYDSLRKELTVRNPKLT